jgi:hypothetical protein
VFETLRLWDVGLLKKSLVRRFLKFSIFYALKTAKAMLKTLFLKLG